MSKAESLLQTLPDPSKESFLKLFKSAARLIPNSKVQVYPLFKIKYDSLIQEERFGTASNLKQSWHSFQRYKKDLYLQDIHPGFIKGYQAYMLSKGCSATTSAIYLRNLRSIYNQAVADGLIVAGISPFKNLHLGSRVKSKAVLYPHHLKTLWEYQPSSETQSKALAFFFFSYLCHGMNFKDIAYLRFSNIHGDLLIFTRQKTKRTKINSSEIRVFISPPVREILNRWGNTSQHPTDHIFPFRDKYEGPKHFNDTITRRKRAFNKVLRHIGRELGFEVPLNIGIARHCFATKHKIDGTPLAYISEFLGHSSVQTTQHYIKSLPEENLQLANQKLLDF